jgi:hypothetical protein
MSEAKQSCYQDWIDEMVPLTEIDIDSVELDEKHCIKLLIDGMPNCNDLWFFWREEGQLLCRQEIHTARSSSCAYPHHVVADEHTLEYLLEGWLARDGEHREECERPLVHYLLMEKPDEAI